MKKDKYSLRGKVLHVNLSTAEFATEELDEDVMAKFIGGRGLGAGIIYNRVPLKVSPLDPSNILAFCTGPLTGTKVPTSSKFVLSTKSPLTGTIFDSCAGGFWGVAFKKCGYDALIIEGKASRPVFILITDDEARLEDAQALFGLDVPETTSRLKSTYGKGSGVVCIGPAGENLVKIASIMVDTNRALGRGGVGAVMGSKNLKAIVARGTRPVACADEDQLDFVIYEANKWLKGNPITSQGLPEFGTPVLVNLINAMGVLPTRNFQESQFPGADLVSGETIAETIFKRRGGCHGCWIQCERLTETKNGNGKGPEYESVWALGPECGVDDLEAVTEANYLCNKFGLDTISTGVTIGCAMELSERGILSEEIRFGDVDKVKELVRKIAYREGIGDELAEGSLRFATQYKAEEYAMQVKGLELPAYDPRGMQAHGLGFATSNRGGCHLRAYMVAPEILGIPKLLDRFSPSGKAGLTTVFQNSHGAMDCLIMCRFAALALSDEYFARLLSAATGIRFEPQDLQKIGERVWNLERLYNIREGFSRTDDTLPKRLLTEPVRSGPSKGYIVELEGMLNDYYRCRGWDRNGIPTRSKLDELGLGRWASR